MTEERAWLIVDSGSGNLAYGESEEEVPKYTVRNCVGIPNYALVANMTSTNANPKYAKKYSDVLFGDALQTGEGFGNKAGMCHIKWPVQRGVVQDMDLMNEIFDKSMIKENNMQIGTNEEDDLQSDFAGIVHLDSLLSSSKGRIDMAENWFEVHGIPRLFFGLSTVCALFADGRQTGASVMSGHGVTEVAPVYEGYGIRNAYQRYNWGGQDVTKWFQRELHKADVSLETSADELIIWNLKEQLSVSPMGKLEEQILEKRGQVTEYEMPDKSTLKLREQVVEVAEIMFDPKRAGHDIPGIARMTRDAIELCPTDAKGSMYGCISLAGSNTMMKGLDMRMREEMDAYLQAKGDQEAKAKIIAKPERATASWNGGRIMTSLSTFSNYEEPANCAWMDKAEYDNSGPDRVVAMSMC